MVKLVIITGVSGSGKSTALYTFEEAGYYVIDNIPLAIVKNLFDTISTNRDYKKVAVAVSLEIANEVYDISKNYQDFETHFVGITCSRDALNERYRLSRKLHPLQARGYTLDEAIERDYMFLEKVRENLTNFIDTSKLDKNEFAKTIHNSIMGINGEKFSVMFMSFGYKKAVPQDIETVFDVRLLPNPYWVPELKDFTGLDKNVRDYVLSAKETKQYLAHVISYLDYYLEELKKSGKRHANIGIACSGGQHRSVVIAQYLYEHYSSKYETSVSHRDIYRK